MKLNVFLYYIRISGRKRSKSCIQNFMEKNDFSIFFSQLSPIKQIQAIRYII